MRLQLDIITIKKVQFGDRTAIADSVLHINRQELQKLLEEDTRFAQVEIELAHPGEKCRIIHVCDIIEPRAKTNGGVDFPDALGEQGSVGQGNTCVLRGAAVIMSEDLRGEDPSNNQIDRGKLLHGKMIDMSLSGSEPAFVNELSTYARTHNVVLLPRRANGVDMDDYRVALKIAGLKAAAYLAKAGKDLDPDEKEVYDLPPLPKLTKGLEGLPKVAYVFQFISGQFGSIPGYPILYGSNADRIAPTILHPNEVLDGAIVTPHNNIHLHLFDFQNHSIIKELYKRHGKDLCFVGVVITVGHAYEKEIERASTMAANLVKWTLGADGVILTKAGGGIPEVAMGLTAKKCEELGIRTAIALAHLPTTLADGHSRTLFSYPELDAVVSLGTPWSPVTLSPVERIIGASVASPGDPPVDGKLETILTSVLGLLSQTGNTRLTAVEY